MGNQDPSQELESDSRGTAPVSSRQRPPVRAWELTGAPPNPPHPTEDLGFSQKQTSPQKWNQTPIESLCLLTRGGP